MDQQNWKIAGQKKGKYSEQTDCATFVSSRRNGRNHIFLNVGEYIVGTRNDVTTRQTAQHAAASAFCFERETCIKQISQQTVIAVYRFVGGNELICASLCSIFLRFFIVIFTNSIYLYHKFRMLAKTRTPE
jgi:hypothetical protein